MSQRTLREVGEEKGRAKPSLRRFVLLSSSALALTACLLSIEESKVDADPDTDFDPDTGVSKRDGSTNPSAKDAEPSVEGPDGARTCSQGLMLCPDNICYDTTGDLSHCGSCVNACGSKLVCRGSQCVPPSSCKELLARAPGTPTGVAELTIGGLKLPAYCDMTTNGGGWTLVYRVSRGIPGDPYGLLMGGPQNDDVAAEVTPLVRPKHYVSRLLGDWNVGFMVTEVRARLLNTAGTTLHELVFNGGKTTRESWFSKDPTRLKDPGGWDVTKATDIFSAAGHKDRFRNFFITEPYVGCDGDRGWLVVHGTNTGTLDCPYESPANNVRIYYSGNATSQQWSAGVPEADSFAVFAR